MSYTTEHSISFQNKIPSLHTLAKCAALACGHDTFRRGLLDLQFTKTQVMAHGTNKAHDHVKCSSVQCTDSFVKMK